jgi:hypothetical protein
VAPVPITATRLPVKSTFSLGHREVWNDWLSLLKIPSEAELSSSEKLILNLH